MFHVEHWRVIMPRSGVFHVEHGGGGTGLEVLGELGESGAREEAGGVEGVEAGLGVALAAPDPGEGVEVAGVEAVSGEGLEDERLGAVELDAVQGKLVSDRVAEVGALGLEFEAPVKEV